MSEPTQDRVGDLIGMATDIGIVVGVLVATQIASIAARRFIEAFVDRSGLEAFAERVGAARVLYALGVRRGVAKVSGSLARGAVWVLGVWTLSKIFEFAAIDAAVSAFIAFVPDALAALALVAAGVWAGALAREAIAPEPVLDEDTDQPGAEDASRVSALAVLGGRLAQGAIVALAMTLALEQIGVATDVVHGAVTAVFTVAALCVGALFALASRRPVEHVIARHLAKRLLRVGDTLELPELGACTLVGFTSHAAILEPEEGGEDPLHTLVPFPALLAQPFVMRMGDAGAAEEE